MSGAPVGRPAPDCRPAPGGAAPAGRRVVMVTVHTSPIAGPGSADAGGMNVMVSSIAAALADRGWQVDLVTRRTAPDQPDRRDVHPGVTLHHLPVGPPVTVPKPQAERLIAPFADAFDTWCEEHGGGVDIIHSHHWFSAAAVLDIARRRGIPHAVSYHSVAAAVGEDGLDAGEQPESDGRRAGEQRAAAESDLVIAVSDTEKQMIIQRCGADPDAIDVVRPGVDLDLFHPRKAVPSGPTGAAPTAAAQGEGPHRLACVARLEPLKGIDQAIRILAALRDEDVTLTIAGAAAEDYRDYERRLHALTAELGVSDRVRFVGAVDREDLAALLAGSDLLINPSYSETYGIINIEAAASGTPVIAHRSSGMRESVIDHVTGILMDTRDPSAWADGIRTLITSPAALESLSRSAAERAQRRTWACAAEQLEDSYESSALR